MKVECCICLEEFSSNEEEKITTPKCGHLYHESCINGWLTNNEDCPQCRQTVRTDELRIIHLTSSVTSRRRSSIFNSTLCQDYRELNENLLRQQDTNREEVDDLKEQVKKLAEENSKLKKELHAKNPIGKLMADNDLLEKEISGGNKRGPVPERQAPISRHQPLDSLKNVESIVAKAWKKN